MPNCMICKRSAYSGHVLCPDCARSLEPNSLSTKLAWVLDQLAEEIVLSNDISSCTICENGECSSQASGLVCRIGVKNWLVSKALGYLKDFSGEVRE